VGVALDESQALIYLFGINVALIAGIASQLMKCAAAEW